MNLYVCVFFCCASSTMAPFRLHKTSSAVMTSPLRRRHSVGRAEPSRASSTRRQPAPPISEAGVVVELRRRSRIFGRSCSVRAGAPAEEVLVRTHIRPWRKGPYVHCVLCRKDPTRCPELYPGDGLRRAIQRTHSVCESCGGILAPATPHPHSSS